MNSSENLKDTRRYSKLRASYRPNFLHAKAKSYIIEKKEMQQEKEEEAKVIKTSTLSTDESVKLKEKKPNAKIRNNKKLRKKSIKL